MNCRTSGAELCHLTVEFDEAWRRAAADLRAESRRTRTILAAHYRALGDETPDDGDLVLEAGDVSVSLAARSVADWLLPPLQ